MARRWNTERRNELAAAKLRALGIDPGGRSPYTVWRKLTTAQRAAGVHRLARAEPTYHGGGRNVIRKPAKPKAFRPTKARRKVTDMDQLGVRLVVTSDPREVKAQLRWAVANGKKVTLRVTYDTPQGPRTHNIDQRPVKSPKGRFQPEGDQRKPLGKIQMVIADAGNPVFRYPPLNPQDVLDLIAAHRGDVWAAVAELWADSE